MPERTPEHRPILHLPKHKAKQTDRQSTRAYHTGSKGWQIIRTKILVRDMYSCVMCGHTDASNEVDHIDGDSGNNDESNLRTLCRRCHAKHGVKGRAQSGRKYVIA